MMQAQFEIIRPTGEIEFYALDSAKRVVNIGRHPDNDIVIDSPRVAEFHAVLNQQRQPYQLLVLSPEGALTLNEQLLRPNVAISLNHRDTLAIDGHLLILLETGPGAPVASSPAIPSVPTQPVQTPPPPHAPPPATSSPIPSLSPPASTASPSAISAPAPPATAGQVQAGPGITSAPGSTAPPQGGPSQGSGSTVHPPGSPEGSAGVGTGVAASHRGWGQAVHTPDYTNPSFVVEMVQREWTLAVDETATLELTITNGGNLVSSFEIQIVGLYEAWLTYIEPPDTLSPGDEAQVVISITLPKHPTSQAGRGHFTVVVESPEYGRQQGEPVFCQLGATLTIVPYYEYSVSQLSPAEQTTTWRSRTGVARFTITNQGNADTRFRLEGADRQQLCQFEFDLPYEATPLAGQADLTIPLHEPTAYIDVFITPTQPRLVGLRNAAYPFTITTTILSDVPLARQLQGQLSNKPLFGPIALLLVMLSLLVCTVLTFRPRIHLFTTEPQIVDAGDPVLLRWNVSRLANARIDQNVGGLDDSVGEATAIPPINDSSQAEVVYTLRATNWLSRLLPSLFEARREVKVIVTPVLPEILVFSSDQSQILLGDEVIVNWEVDHADELILESNGFQEPLRSEDHSDRRDLALEDTTTMILIARNQFGEQKQVVTVEVQTPTPTATPTLVPPNIALFNVQPREVTQGDSVSIDWAVTNADRVSIVPIPGELDPSGSLNPVPDKTTLYILTASNGNPDQDVRLPREVIVNTPTPTITPTPEPIAPEIVSFDPPEGTEIELGKEIELSWLVRGEITDISISASNFGPITGRPAEGTLTVVPSEEQNAYSLTARNGDLVVRETRLYKINVPPPPSPTPLPPANIDIFEISTPNFPQVDDRGGNPQTYRVIKGTTVTFRWQVDTNAVQAVLSKNGLTPLVEMSPVGSHNEPIEDEGTFVLEVTNAENKTSRSTIKIELAEQLPPDAPFNVRVETTENGNQVTWDWSFVAGKSNIEGFRIYRVDGDDGNPIKIADESKLLADVKGFIDPINPTCDRGYFVRAIFLNLQGEAQESETSTNSWYTEKCKP